MTQPSQPDSGEKSPSLTIMVIDPDILVRSAIAEYLRDCGYIVIEGVGVEDVWTVLDANCTIDIILVDVRLTDSVDGFQLARRLRDEHPAIDVILASGTAKIADKVGELCDDGPLEKPYHPDEVLRRINLLRARRSSDRKT